MPVGMRDDMHVHNELHRWIGCSEARGTCASNCSGISLDTNNVYQSDT